MKKFFAYFAFVLITATAFGQDIELNGTVSAQNNQIKNVADPTDDQDAVTKAYTDAILSSQGLMNFNDWTTNLINQDYVTLQLETNSFVFINGNNPLLVLPETAQEFDVIYFYAFRPSYTDSGQFITNIKANGSPFIINTSGGLTWNSGPNDYSSGLLFDGLHMAIFVQGSWRFTFSNFLCVSSSFDNSLLWYLDIDGDGYGDYNWTAYPSNCPPHDSDSWVNNNLDCNDEDPTIYPGATEIQDGIDNNCDGEIDEGFNFSTVTDIDGNTYDYLNYGDQVWTVENAEMVTYRDGTPIPQVQNQFAWEGLTSGAWCYYQNDPSKGKLYNWYAVMGIHDTDPTTPNKEFAPEGWHVPNLSEWNNLLDYLITGQFSFSGSSGNGLAKSLASVSNWNSSNIIGSPGRDQTNNNSSGFNALPTGYISNNGFGNYGSTAQFWSSTENDLNYSKAPRMLNTSTSFQTNTGLVKYGGLAVRFVRD